jgi:hypothetical protein
VVVVSVFEVPKRAVLSNEHCYSFAGIDRRSAAKGDDAVMLTAFECRYTSLDVSTSRVAFYRIKDFARQASIPAEIYDLRYDRLGR